MCHRLRMFVTPAVLIYVLTLTLMTAFSTARLNKCSGDDWCRCQRWRR